MVNIVILAETLLVGIYSLHPAIEELVNARNRYKKRCHAEHARKDLLVEVVLASATLLRYARSITLVQNASGGYFPLKTHHLPGSCRVSSHYIPQ